jgi:hypothetical protein
MDQAVKERLFYPLHDQLPLWEVIASIQIFQALQRGWHVCFHSNNGDVSVLCGCAGVPFLLGGGDATAGDCLNLAYSAAYRAVEVSLDKSYVEVLAAESGYPGLVTREPQFLNMPVQEERNDIILCPWGLKTELDMPVSCWLAISKHLRSYGCKVCVMGQPGKRLDGYTEDEVLSELPILEKMQALASAKLVVGVPNEYTWMATAWERKIALLYSDSIPPRRWFPWAHDNWGRILFETHMISIPVLLAGLRELIKILPE